MWKLIFVKDRIEEREREGGGDITTWHDIWLSYSTHNVIFKKINDGIGLTHETIEYTHDRTRFTHDAIGLIFDRIG